MPCLSYDTEWAKSRVSSSLSDMRKLKEEADKLARIACQALAELEKCAPDSKLLVGNTETTKWWKAHKKADAERIEKERKEKEKKAEVARLRKSALSKLSADERAAYGLK